MAVSTQTREKTVSRTVVLLRHNDRKKLNRLAAKEQVSAGEIIRRSLDSYQTIEARARKEEEEKMMAAALSVLCGALKQANDSVRKTNSKLDKLHLQLKKREIQ